MEEVDLKHSNHNIFWHHSKVLSHFPALLPFLTQETLRGFQLKSRF